MVQQLPWGDLCKQGFLVLQLEDPRFVNHVKDQHAFLKLCLGVDIVIVHARLPCDLFFTNDGRLVVVRYGQVIYSRSCGAMKIEVPLVSRLIFSRRLD